MPTRSGECNNNEFGNILTLIAYDLMFVPMKILMILSVNNNFFIKDTTRKSEITSVRSPRTNLIRRFIICQYLQTHKTR